MTDKKINLETKKLRSKDGTIAYYSLNKLHNTEGPALIPQGDNKKAEYYLFGIKYSKEQWLLKQKDTNGVPFYKSSVGKSLGNRF